MLGIKSRQMSIISRCIDFVCVKNVGERGKNKRTSTVRVRWILRSLFSFSALPLRLVVVWFAVNHHDGDVVIPTGGVGTIYERPAAGTRGVVGIEVPGDLLFGEHVGDAIAADEDAIVFLQFDLKDVGVAFIHHAHMAGEHTSGYVFFSILGCEFPFFYQQGGDGVILRQLHNITAAEPVNRAVTHGGDQAVALFVQHPQKRQCRTNFLFPQQVTTGLPEKAVDMEDRVLQFHFLFIEGQRRRARCLLKKEERE